MKNKKFAKSIAGILACTAMLTGVIPAASLSSSAAEYKVYKNDVTVNFYGEQISHDEFEGFWVAVYENFGADVTIEFVKDYTGSPHSEEWIRTGGPVFFGGGERSWLKQERRAEGPAGSSSASWCCSC